MELQDGGEISKVEARGENADKKLDQINDMVAASDSVVRIKVEIESEEFLDPSNIGRDSSGEIETISFKSESEAYTIAQCMEELDDDWSNTGEIKRVCSEKCDVPEDRISQVLWDLSQRGILRKRDCESDGRMKEYKISKVGRHSVEEVTE